MNDSWSSEAPPDPAGAPRAPADDPAATSRRSDRYGHRDAPADGARERHPWIGLGFLFVGLVTGAVALGLIARELDQPGVADVDAARWWLVVGSGVAIAWAAPWFLRPRNRRRMAIVLAICTAAVVVVAAIAIDSLDTQGQAHRRASPQVRVIDLW